MSAPAILLALLQRDEPTPFKRLQIMLERRPIRDQRAG
jgi:hypothetical protein